MDVRVYLPGGADTDTLYIPEGQDPLDVIFLEFGLYLEFDIL